MSATLDLERMDTPPAPGRQPTSTPEYVLPLAAAQATLASVGGKGASLARLARAGLPVPGGFHVTTDAYRQFVETNGLQPHILAALQLTDAAQPASLERASQAIGALFAAGQMPPDVAGALAQAYGALPGQDPAVAVRSSATAEDLPEASFAGQQETYLNVRGVDAVLAMVQKCWASLWTARAIGYRARQGVAPEGVALAVVVQVLIPAEAAGILFTANPVTGARGQAVISAAWGLGEAIVGGQVTPDALTVDKATGKVLERQTADKQVMTVPTGDGTAERPVPEALRRAPVLNDEAAAGLVGFGLQIEQLYGMPMDVEWALADGQIAILQARPITALPEQALPAPTEWKLPKGCYAAIRNNIVELMADPLSPLFATLGRSAINASLHRVLNDSFGLRGVMPDEIIIVVNHYAYNNGSVSVKGLARVIFGAGTIMRKMFTGAVERWTEAGRPRYYQTVGTWQTKDWRAFTAVELADAARRLTEAAIDAYSALISGAIPAAWITEALFTTAYNRLIKRRGDPPAPTYLLGYDSLPIRADKALYTLAEWGQQYPPLRDYLDQTPTPLLAALEEGAPATVPQPMWQEWRRRLQQHLRQFGHTLYDLDFAHPVPGDDPAPVLDAFKLYLRGQGVDPHARQAGAAQRREQAVAALDQRLNGWRKKLFHRLLTPAQRYAPLREDGLAEIGLAYPLIRQMLRELGRRFAQRGIIPSADDVFWLTEREVVETATSVDAGEPAEPLADRLPQRKAEWKAALRASPPMALPQMKVFGFDLMSLKSRRGRGAKGDKGEVIRGVAASPGQVTGVARVLTGPDHFSQMRPGDVLVASITTPAWTPLFAMASAVVTDIGGPLSHGSIVAREYGIPAVLGTGVATRRLHSGDTVTVDGTAGKVWLKARSAPAGPPALEWPRPHPKAVLARGSFAEFVPEPISPLFATLAVPMAREATVKLMGSLGATEKNSYLFEVINDYVYVGFVFTPRMIWAAVKASLFMIIPVLKTTREREAAARAKSLAAAQKWQARPLSSLSPSELLVGVREIFGATAEYYTVAQSGPIPMSLTTEGIFAGFYNRLVKRKGDPDAATFVFGSENQALRAEKSLFDLVEWAKGQPGLAEALLQTPTGEIIHRLTAVAAPVDDAAWDELRSRFAAHLAQFGHAMFDLDFAKPVPADQPAPLVEAMKAYLSGSANPYARQRAALDRRERAAAAIAQRLDPLRRKWFLKLLKWAQDNAPLREDSIADVGLGYPQLRRMLGELGRRLAAGGAILEADDVYWLEAPEADDLAASLETGAPLPPLAGAVAERKAKWQAMRRITPPNTLPQKTWMARFYPSEGQTGDTLKGFGASPGKVTARACVMLGPEDFGRMHPGDVIVAGITTPAWTPLFARAAAIVTDIGGPLSHSSIVAREYGLPAVLGTGVATRRIRSGDLITVDGGAGTVTLSHDGQ